MLDTPVLFIVFNRPDTTQIVFNAIRKAKPEKLYISADAPREGNKDDEFNCSRVREIVKLVDWKCDVSYRFLDENLGCGYGVSSAISWAFENEESLIILEDDCVPSLSFFSFCSFCLEKYINDTRVWLISGRSHHQGSKFFINHDYVFSHYGHIWGWATWKRCWKEYDIEMKDLPDFLNDGGAINVLSSKKEGTIINNILLKISKKTNLPKSTWDYQFFFTLLKNGGFSIIPAKNLIKNIGHIGTHTKKVQNSHSLEADEDYTIRKEPKFIMINKKYEKLHFKKHMMKIFGMRPFYKSFLKKVLFGLLKLKK